MNIFRGVFGARPQPGEIWVRDDDPFNLQAVRIVEVRRRWVKYEAIDSRGTPSWTSTLPLFDFRTLYRRILDATLSSSN